MTLIKTRYCHQVAKYCKRSIASVILFCKKKGFQNTGFSHRLKRQLKQKKIDTAYFVKTSQVSADKGMGK